MLLIASALIMIEVTASSVMQTGIVHIHPAKHAVANVVKVEQTYDSPAAWPIDTAYALVAGHSAPAVLSPVTARP